MKLVNKVDTVVGAAKFANRNPAISSMTIIPGSFCRRISLALLASHIAQKWLH
jgi:hypothetical protein